MSEKDTLRLLDDIATMYPLFMKDRDAEKLSRIWTECLQYYKADDIHDAFIRYCATDQRNIPPTPGNLIELVSPDWGERIE